ncbi:MAG: hypothetical protein A2X28_00765 [Elusimicrobia bacterium GWA2_56_46]|jgi:hypothetical protein|nr:MAG: hypothetical protein A2X28_00765 [Elusimicrobia bacterium GWA2_56_46]OGR55896.1 MAG: hypothetical protein A2X39_06130 [Elusimicrobia bacterium GWC2_56_31]HBB67551.1 hypothetical protein [Elusimicrobiota bacterium]HBW22169.1 hypothetical protein [Elusimicrobiota bacterium]
MNDVLARNILLLGALEEIRAAAGGKNLKFILLKGAALLTEGVYGPGEREMTDLDILIRPADEKAFDDLLMNLGFRPMENSSQAYYRPAPGAAPPVIADLHTGLWHEKDAEILWRRAVNVPESANLTVPGFADQLLHLASHTLLYHGRLGSRTLEDLGRLLEFIYRKTERAAFWREASGIADGENLRPALYPVLTRLAAAAPALISGEELSAFAPHGAEKLKSRFFEKAASGHSRPLEYFLPALYRPALFFRYLFPEKSFLERRYGRRSWTNRLIRPFQLIKAIFKEEE